MSNAFLRYSQAVISSVSNTLLEGRHWFVADGGSVLYRLGSSQAKSVRGDISYEVKRGQCHV